MNHNRFVRIKNFWDGHLERLEIRSRADSLDKALVGFIRDPNESKLRGYLFSSLPEADREKVSDELRRCASADVNHWKDVPRILEDVGVPYSVAQRLENAWDKLIALGNAGGLTVCPWSTSFQWNGTLERNLQQSRRHIEHKIVTPSGQGALTAAWQDRTYRSRVIADLRSRFRQEKSNVEAQDDIATVESWFNGAYSRTVADQHKCYPVEITEAPGSRPSSRIAEMWDRCYDLLKVDRWPEDVPDGLRVAIPASFMEKLGEWPRKDFDRFMNNAKQRDSLAAWYENQSNVPELRRVIDALVATVDHDMKMIGSPGRLLSLVTPPLRFVTGAARRLSKRIKKDVGKDRLGRLLGVVAIVGDELQSEIRHVARRNVSRCIIERARSFPEAEEL